MFLQACLDGLKVFQLQLGVYYLLVAHGVDGAVDVSDVVVIETAQHVYDGVSLAYVSEKLVAQPFSF